MLCGRDTNADTSSLLLLLGIATLFKSVGWAAVALVYALLLTGLELLYRVVRSFLDRHKATWWGKPRQEIPRAYAGLAVMILIFLVESRLARSWLVATTIGAVVVAAAIHPGTNVDDLSGATADSALHLIDSSPGQCRP
jgi:hypothetical protein